MDKGPKNGDFASYIENLNKQSLDLFKQNILDKNSLAHDIGKENLNIDKTILHNDDSVDTLDNNNLYEDLSIKDLKTKDLNKDHSLDSKHNNDLENKSQSYSLNQDKEHMSDSQEPFDDEDEEYDDYDEYDYEADKTSKSNYVGIIIQYIIVTTLGVLTAIFDNPIFIGIAMVLIVINGLMQKQSK